MATMRSTQIGMGSVELKISVDDSVSGTVRFPERRIRLNKDQPRLPIGRSSQVLSKGFNAAGNNGWFDSPVMSRNHAEIVADFEKKTLTLTDIGSTHGTFLGASDVRMPQNMPQNITSGSMVRFGTRVWRGSEQYAPITINVDIIFQGGRVASPSPFVIEVPEDSDEEDEEDEHEPGKLVDGTLGRPLPVSNIAVSSILGLDGANDECMGLPALLHSEHSASHYVVDLTSPSCGSHDEDCNDYTNRQSNDEVNGAVAEQPIDLSTNGDTDIDHVYGYSDDGLGCSDNMSEDVSESESESDANSEQESTWDLNSERLGEDEMLGAITEIQKDGPEPGEQNQPPLQTEITAKELPATEEEKVLVSEPALGVHESLSSGNAAMVDIADMDGHLDLGHAWLRGSSSQDDALLATEISPWLATGGEFLRSPLPPTQEPAESSAHKDLPLGSAYEFKKARLNPKHGATSEHKRTRVGIADLVNVGSPRFDTSHILGMKRKSDDISGLSEADVAWLAAKDLSQQKTSTNQPADVCQAPPATATLQCGDSSAPTERHLRPKASSSDQELGRPTKRLRNIAERLGYAALGGATVGAMMLGTLIYTAPSFA